MPTDATGAPTSLGIRTYNTSADAPSGLGFNGAMADIDALLVARLALTGAPTITGQVPIWNNTTHQWVPGTLSSGATYQKITTVKTVNTSVAPTDLLTGLVTIPILTATSTVRLTAWGDFLQNSGSNTPGVPQIQVSFGGTVQLDTGANTGIGASALRNGWRIVVEIQNENATNVQWINVDYRVGLKTGFAAATSTIFATGEGAGGPAGTAPAAWVAQGGNAGAIDTTAARALLLNVINASASATYETVLKGAVVEIF